MARARYLATAAGSSKRGGPRKPPDMTKDLIRVTVRMPPAQYTRMRVYAAEHNLSGEQVVRKALDMLLGPAKKS